MTIILTPREAEALDNHAEKQARAQLSSIRDMLAAYQLDWEGLEEMRDQYAEAVESCEEIPDELRDTLEELEEAAREYASQDDAMQAMIENPLDISFRSGWTSSREDMQPEEFQILLCTGGPAVRIIGDLDEYGQPCRAWIEYQDWGTPWTMLFDGQADALEYAQHVIYL